MQHILVMTLVIMSSSFSVSQAATPEWLVNATAKCVDYFTIKPVKFYEGRAEARQWPREGNYKETFKDKIPLDGYTLMTGFVDSLRPGTITNYRTAILGSLNYTIVGNQLTLVSLVHKPQFDGQGVYFTLLGSIIAMNDQVDTIVGTLNGENYVAFKNALAANGGDMQMAIKETVAGQELAKLGFKEVLWVEAINYAASSSIPEFYRFGVKRQLSKP